MGRGENELDDHRRSNKSSHHHRSHKDRKERQNVDDLPGSSGVKPSSAHRHQSANPESHKSRPSSKATPTGTPKPSYIPTESATSPQQKWDRIEKWRREGAKCLLQKQETEETLRTMYSSHHKEERSRKGQENQHPSTSKGHAHSHSSRHHHHDTVGSDVCPGVTEEVRTEEVKEDQEGKKKSSKVIPPQPPLSTSSSKVTRSSSVKIPEKSESHATTLRVMNLPQSLTLNDLKNLFPESTSVTILIWKEFGGVESDISVGQATVNPTTLVRFNSRAEAKEVMDQLQGLKIRGHKLKISLELGHHVD